MGLSSTQQDTEVMAEINITPFTDVLLVLLIIFMILAALAAPPGFQKQLPSKAHNQPQNIKQKDLQKNIEVVVTANNRIFIDRKLVPEARLYPEMQAAYQFHLSHANQGYKTHISLLADTKASYNYIIKVLDAARQAGDDDVGFVTE